jgi:recombination protein RecR
MKLPDPIKNVVDELSRLPSIGPRQAIRLAFYLVNESKENIHNLAVNINNLRTIKICERCFFIHQNKGDLCDICANPNRRSGVIMIVEKETDLLSMENTGKFTGRYCIVGPIPKTGILEDWQKLRLQSLKKFIESELGGTPSQISSDKPSEVLPRKILEGKADEIILGFNPTSLGDLQTSILTKELSPFAKKISRLGRGLPTGGEIEFADDETLGNALERRS